jgi:hypothetical protein
MFLNDSELYFEKDDANYFSTAEPECLENWFWFESVYVSSPFLYFW